MHTKRAIRAIPALLLLGAALAACGGEDAGTTTITSNSEGIVDVGADTDATGESPTPATGEADLAVDHETGDAANEGEADEGPVGTVTIDGIDHSMNQINRCIPADQTTERIEAVNGIESLETLNLVAVGDDGMFEMYFADFGTRSLMFSWSGDAGSLEQTYGQVEGGDWRGEEGTVPGGQLLDVVDGSAVGGATIDDRELRFELPIPAEATC